MGIPRANKLIRATLGVGPCETTVKDRVNKIQESFKAHLLPDDIPGRLRRAARLWTSIIEQKIKSGDLEAGHLVPITCGADATPVPAHPQYCEKRNIIFGLCGSIEGEHKCTLEPPEQILDGEAGFNQIVRLVRTNVWSSYVYVHILQPQVDWLPPVHVLVYATCNSYDHLPHLESFWIDIRRQFKEVMRGVPVMLTGKGADGDPKERTMFLQQMYSRWRGKHHPRLSVFSAPLAPSSNWIWLEGLSTSDMFVYINSI
jgi:hypothetical protein